MRLDAAVQVRKIHAGGFEQHFPALFGHHKAVFIPAHTQGYRVIFLHAHPHAAGVFHRFVQNTLTIGGLMAADGIPPRQQRGKGQGARRIQIVQLFAAEGAIRPAQVHLGKAVWAENGLTHGSEASFIE